MKWIKQGKIFSVNHDGWMKTHAQLPVPLKKGDDLLRIFFSTRDEKGRSRVTYIDVKSNNLKEIVYVHKQPILPLGKLGTFDDSGIMPSSIVEHNNDLYLYYIGWTPLKTVSYKLSIGLAISTDGGNTFTKYSEAPILDTSSEDPIFVSAPCVIKEKNKWKMWYISCTEWKIINGKTEPVYLVKYAESDDGINWYRERKPCIDYEYDGEAIGRPWVVKEGRLYKMWYSKRGSIDYRSKNGQHYIIGYAESVDGKQWERKDSLCGISLSKDGWDSEMMEYCSIININNQNVMFYNGNGFGESGFGYAISTSS